MSNFRPLTPLQSIFWTALALTLFALVLAVGQKLTGDVL
jgi:hypothetical protein